VIDRLTLTVVADHPADELRYCRLTPCLYLL
jgi:hypothetical protein